MKKSDTSKKIDERTWREFERLVARIEAALVPKGAVVKSPDQIRDKVSGELREVDASVKYRIGSAEVLIIVECRDRKRVEDMLWIEQLAQKRHSLGASKCIAVSSSGFSKAARAKGEAFDIDLRRISRFEPSKMSNWDIMTTAEIQYLLHRAHFWFGEDANENWEELNKEIRRTYTLRDLCLKDTKTKTLLTIEDLFNLINQNAYAFGKKEKSDLSAAFSLDEEKISSCAWPEPHYSINTSSGEMLITSVGFEYRIEKFNDYSVALPGIFYSYENGDQKLATGIEMKVKRSDGELGTLSFQSDLLASSSEATIWTIDKDSVLKGKKHSK